MDSDRHALVKKVFLQICDLPEQDRPAALEHYFKAVTEYQKVLASGVRIHPEMLVRYAQSLEHIGRVTAAITVYELLLNHVSPADGELIRNKIKQLRDYLADRS